MPDLCLIGMKKGECILYYTQHNSVIFNVEEKPCKRNEYARMGLCKLVILIQYQINLY